METMKDLPTKLEDAYSALEKEQWAEAQGYFQQVLDQDPQNQEARVSSAYCLFRLEQYPQALDQMIPVLQSQLHNLEVIQNLPLIFEKQEIDPVTGFEAVLQKVPCNTAIMLQLENMALEKGETSTANAWLQRILAVPADEAPAWLNRGIGYSLVGDVESARQAYDQMVASAPQDLDVFFRRADFLAATGDLPAALADLDMVSQLNPDTAVGYQQSGELLFQNEEFAPAKEMYQKALERDSENQEVRMKMADCLFRLGQYPQALEQVIRVLQSQPHNLDLVQDILRIFEKESTDTAAGLEGVWKKVPGSTAIMLHLENTALEKEDTSTANAWLEKLLMVPTDSSAVWFNQALGYRLVGNMESARQAYDQMVASAPQDPDVFLRRADFLAAMDAMPGALADLETVSQMDPNTNIGYQQSGELLFQKQEFARAREMYQKALEREPDDLTSLVGIGLCCESLNDLEEALKIHDQYVEKAPEQPDGYYYRGRIYALQGKLDLAEQNYRQVIRCAPEDRPGHLALAGLFLDQARYVEAEKIFRKMIRMNPEDAEAHNDLGLALEGQREYQKALKEFRKATKLAPEHPIGHSNSGRMYQTLGRLPDAVEAYSQAIQIDPESLDYYRLRGQAYQAMEKYELAEKDLLICVQRKDKDTAAHLDLAWMYYQWGAVDRSKLEEALDTCEKILAWDEKDPVVYEALATIYEDLNEPMSALRMYNRLLVLDPASIAGYAGRGRVYLCLEDEPKGLADLNKALERDPNETTALFNRALMWQAVNDQSRALKDFRALTKLLPENAQAHRYLADTFYDLEGYDLAVREYDRIPADDPGYMEALMNKADSLRRWASSLNDPKVFRQAIKVADQLIRASREKTSGEGGSLVSEAHAIKAFCLNGLGRVTEAMQAYDEAIALKPDYFWAINEKGKALYRNARYEQALKLFRALKKLAKDYRVNATAGEGLALRKLGKKQQAQRVLDSLLKKSSAASRYLDRCFALHEMGENELAVKDGKKAIRLDKNLAAAFNEVAWILAEDLQTELEYATTIAERGVKLEQEKLEQDEQLDQSVPKNAAKAAASRISLGLVLDTLGWIWYRRGDLKRALAYLQQGLAMQEQDQEKRYHVSQVKRANALAAKRRGRAARGVGRKVKK